MKKLLSIFALGSLLFNTFLQNFTYAEYNSSEEEAINILNETIIQTINENDEDNNQLNTNLLSQNSWEYSLYDATSTSTLVVWTWFNKIIKELANNNGSKEYTDYDENITKILFYTWTDVPAVKVTISESWEDTYAWFDNWIIYIYSMGHKIYLNEDSSYMFYRLKNLVELDFNKFDTSKVENMENTFAYTEKMKTINLKNSDLSNVENMKFTFYNAGLTEIDLSWKNLNKVTTMMDMFYNSKDLEKVDFTNILLNSVTDISTMFPYYCYEWNTYCPYSKLEEVKFTNAKLWNLKQIWPTMFYRNDNLKYVDFSWIDLHSLESLSTIFDNTKELEYANFDYADLRNITEINVFRDTPKLKKIQFSHAILSWLVEWWNIASNAKSINEVDFSYADLRSYKWRWSWLRDLYSNTTNSTPDVEIYNFSNANLSSLETMNYLFGQTKNIKEINFENTKLDSLTTMENLFNYAKIPEKVIFKNNNINKLTNVSQMFYNSYSWTTISFKNIDLSHVTTMSQMFYEAKDIKKVDLSNLDLRNVQNMQNMFYEAEDLEEINFSWTQFWYISDMWSMIQYTKIKTLDLSNKTFIVGNAWSAFWNNPELTSVDFSNTKFIGWNLWTLFYNSTWLKEANFKNTLFIGSYLWSFFQYNTSLEKADFENAIFSWWKYMSTFFYDAPSLKEVNFNNTKFIGSYNLWSFFSKCTNIEKIDFNNVIFSWWGNMYTFFYNAPNLKEINFNNSRFIGDYNMEGMISDLPSLGKVNLENTVFSWNFNMKKMFYNDQNLTELDLSSFDSSNITNATSMFEKSSNLKTIYATNEFNRINSTNSELMFSWAVSLKGWNGTRYNSNYTNWTYAIIDDENNSWYFTNILDKPYIIEYELRWWVFKWEVVNTYTTRNWWIFPKAIMTWFEFAWWYETWATEPFTFTNTTKWDKILYAHWKSLEKKAEETKAENVVYTNTTTVTVWDEQSEEILSWSSTLSLVSKEIESNEVTKEKDITKVQDSEIKVTSDKTVEYEWWLEVYLEKREDTWKEVKTGKVEWTIKFSAPVAVKIPISSDAEYVKVQVKHWDEDFGFKWLTLNPANECNNWEAINDKYNWEEVEVKNNNSDKYATIYTCSASTFVAYTENTKPINNTISVSSPAAWGGRIVTSTKNENNISEQEHNSADTEKAEAEETTTKTTDTQTIKEQVNKIEWRSLTRWEVAVMTNILLDVYPQLTEWRTELSEVSEVCETYTDEQNFTKDEKKAITRLCKLSIMWIHADNNKPLEEFLVNDKSTNDEFSKVINRSLKTYTEKDFSVVKDALKKLEWDEGNVVFGTVYDVFMGIKNIFN